MAGFFVGLINFYFEQFFSRGCLLQKSQCPGLWNIPCGVILVGWFYIYFFQGFMSFTGLDKLFHQFHMLRFPYLENMPLVPISDTGLVFYIPTDDSFSVLSYVHDQCPRSILRLPSGVCRIGRTAFMASGFTQSSVLILIGVSSLFLSPNFC